MLDSEIKEIDIPKWDPHQNIPEDILNKKAD